MGVVLEPDRDALLRDTAERARARTMQSAFVSTPAGRSVATVLITSSRPPSVPRRFADWSSKALQSAAAGLPANGWQMTWACSPRASRCWRICQRAVFSSDRTERSVVFPEFQRLVSSVN